LVHEGRLKRGACFSFEKEATVELLNGVLLVNPKYLAAEVREALDAYVALLTRSDAERQRLVRDLKRDLEDDFDLAGTRIGPEQE
jgi:hypothetical protein